MQLIREADNSDINIKEKMTAVEDSIDKLMNGVAEFENSPENVNRSEPDNENKVNGDNVSESQKNMESGYKAVLEEVQAQLREDTAENKTTEKEKIPNPDKEDVLNENKGEIVAESCCDETSKNNPPWKEKVSLLETDQHINSLNEDKVTEIQENVETGDKFVSGPPDSFSENLLPCEDVSENNATEGNDENHVVINSSESACKISSDGESCVDISEETEMSLDKHEEVKSEEDLKEELDDENNIAEKQEVTDNKLKTKDPEEISEQKIKEMECVDSDVKLTETTAKLCHDIENHNDSIEKVKEETLPSGQNIDENDVCPIVDNKVGESDVIQNQTQECRNDVTECNLKKSNDKFGNTIPFTKNVPKTCDTDMQTIISPILNSTVTSTELPNNECSDEEVPVVIEPNELTPSAMDCDSIDSDFLEKRNTKILLDKASNKQITRKEGSQVDKTHTHSNEATDEVSEDVLKDVKKNNGMEEKDASIITEPTVVENMDTSEEIEEIKDMIKTNEMEEKDASIIKESTIVENMDTSEEIEKVGIIKQNETSEICIKEEGTSTELKDGKETVNKDDSVRCALTVSDSPCNDVSSDIKEIKVVDIDKEKKTSSLPVTSEVADKPVPVVKLSNTLNILSDDEDDPPKTLESLTGSPPKTPEILAGTSIPNDNKQCINIEDDDDVMVIEDIPRQEKPESISSDSTVEKKDDLKCDSDATDGKINDVIKETENVCDSVKEPEPRSQLDDSPQTTEKNAQIPAEIVKKDPPLLPKDLFKSYKKNLTEMTRDDLEEFCILKIVESIIDRSSLNEIKTKLKTMAQTIEEYKKKAMMLTKQNRDLQVVLKSVQEEQKKGADLPIVPLKITRSVGMQVLMTDKNARRKVTPTPLPGPSSNVNNRPTRNINQSPRQQTPVNATNQQIPVPRLVPATNNNAANKAPIPSQVAATRNPAKPNSSIPNGMRNSPPAPKAAEKRVRPQSITVDLTDDEPPPKIPAPPVRVVSSQNLLTPRAQATSNTLTNPRKVYIPIGTNQNTSVRPGQTIMLKNVPNTSGPRPRAAAPMTPRGGPTTNQIRMSRVPGRHPAPLPDAIKQYQPPNWKALPPAPDLKLSKVENGIVISWKIDGYQEDSYEEIASYQLYAYQETSSPPNTSLWKKIGDVKALPLPMACTLTQFMAGYKYYFAVRAVDIRSRLGPFSLPGSILLLNKM